MRRIKANYWKVDECKYKLQLQTNVGQKQIEEVLSGWQCVSFGYIPKTEEDIYVFEKRFNSKPEWNDFLKSAKVNQFIDMKEIKNE